MWRYGSDSCTAPPLNARVTIGTALKDRVPSADNQRRDACPPADLITARLLSRRDRPLLPLAPWRVVVERASYLPDWARDNNTSLGTVYVAAAPGWFLSPTRPRAAGTRRKCRAFFQRLWPRPKHSYRLGSRGFINGGRNRWTTIDRDPPRRIQGGRWRLIARLWKPGTSVRVRAP
jgi:hypothetical protein